MKKYYKPRQQTEMAIRSNLSQEVQERESTELLKLTGKSSRVGKK